MYKYVISDLDGTLLNKEHKISDLSVSVINKLKEKNIKFAVATGRVYNDVKAILDELSIKAPIISCNGGAYHNIDGDCIYSKFLEDDVAKKIYEYTMKNIVDEDNVINIVKDGIWYIYPISEDQTFDTRHEKPILLDYDTFEVTNINKMFIVNTKRKIDKLEQLNNFLKENDLKVSSAYTLLWCLEIFPYKINKLEGLKALAKDENIELEDMLALGDGMNDYEMLGGVGKGIIMKNGNPNLKNLLKENEITEFENTEHGVAKKLIEIFGLDI